LGVTCLGGCGSSESNASASGAAGPGSSGGSESASSGDQSSVGGATSTSGSGGASSTQGASSSVGGAASGGGGGGGGGGGVPASANDVCVDYLLAYCEHVMTCAGEPERILDCLATYADGCPDFLFAEGSTRTVEGSVACAAAWRSLACDGATPGCATRGELAAGAPCVSHFQCASGACYAEPGTCGACAAEVGEGEPCDYTTSVCVPDLACVDDVCVETQPIVPFTPLDLGAECTAGGGDCGPNGCLSNDDGVYRCQLLPAVGEPCADGLHCADGAYCDEALKCQTLPGGDEPCGLAYPEMIYVCARGITCGDDGVSRTCIGPPGANEYCSSSCEAGLDCVCEDEFCGARYCKTVRLPGESCDGPADQCLASSCAGGVCVGAEPGLFEERCGG